MQLFSALIMKGSHRDSPLKDLSVGRDAGQGLISGTFPCRSGRLATMHSRLKITTHTEYLMTYVLGCVYCTGAGTNEENRQKLRKCQRKKKLHRAGFEPEHTSMQAEPPTHYTNPASPPNTPLFTQITINCYNMELS